jgi:para-aminobenzoate synthetase component 1
MTLPNLASLCSNVQPSVGSFFSYPNSLVGGVFSQDLEPFSAEEFFDLTLKHFEVEGQLRPIYSGVIPYGEPDDINDIGDRAKIYRVRSHIIGSHLPGIDHPKTVETKPNQLIPSTSDEVYLDMVRSIIEDIGEGDYYQLNLLRYFKVEMRKSWHQLINQWMTSGGPRSMILSDKDFCIVSFSPETFFKITSKDAHISKIELRPIKGTISRDPLDIDKDLALQLALSQSEKDQAELNMIIDLMRHDLYAIAMKGSISVAEPPRVISFPSVHHLQASVEAEISKSQTIRSIISALCPAGSITGAPKKAVCKKIRDLEGRSRGFFMGHGIVVYSDGSIETSILIRTLVSEDSRQTWGYAAGSGITIKSRPIDELNEVLLKCHVVL